MALTCDTLPAAWLPAAAGPMPAGQVGVYRAAVLAAGPVPGQHLLPPAELARAARFHHPADQRRYLTARVLRRTVLGSYTGLSPAALEFAASPTHKPYLPAAPTVRFSVAHAGTWVLLAVANAEVGLDLEPLTSATQLGELLATSFLPAEAALLRQRLPRLPEAWTRKEALAKALGWGIDERFAALPGLPGHHAAPSGAWRVSSFEVAAGYVGAVAYPAGYGVRWLEWPLC